MTNDHAGDDAVLRFEAVSKAYPGVVANDHVDLELHGGEIHALVGENGAGKSTLLSILYGLQRRDTGTVYLRGQPSDLASPRAAIQAGIGLVQQHFSVIPTLTLGENVALALRAAGERISPRGAAERITALGSRLGLDVSVDVPVGDLPIAAQQRAEILKALAHDIDVLALDEPNALLTPDEWGHVAAVLRRLAEQGVAILLVSHKLRDVLDLASRVTVLRNGRVVASRSTAGLEESDIGGLMVGEVAHDNGGSAPRIASYTDGAPRLRVESLRVADDRGADAVRDVGLEVRPGEIVGLAGVEGSGQLELAEALMGLRPALDGRIDHGDVEITRLGVRARQQLGIAYIPADRHGSGVIPTMSVADNLLLPELGQGGLSRVGLLRRRSIARRAEALIEDFDIRTPAASVPLASLSGGNQQKVVLARELSREPRTIVACYPTRGLDFAATSFVRQRIVAERERGAAVLFASVDLEELIAWTDRIVVLQGGRIVGELHSSDADAGRLGLLMGGTEVPA